jgi:hypothetical protein
MPIKGGQLILEQAFEDNKAMVMMSENSIISSVLEKINLHIFKKVMTYHRSPPLRANSSEQQPDLS